MLLFWGQESQASSFTFQQVPKTQLNSYSKHLGTVQILIHRAVPENWHCRWGCVHLVCLLKSLKIGASTAPKTTSQIHFQGVWCWRYLSTPKTSVVYSKVALRTSVVFLCAKVSLAAASRVTCQFWFFGGQGRFEVKKLFNNLLSSKNLQWLLAGGWGNSHEFYYFTSNHPVFSHPHLPGASSKGCLFGDMELSIGGDTPWN